MLSFSVPFQFQFKIPYLGKPSPEASGLLENPGHWTCSVLQSGWGRLQSPEATLRFLPNGSWCAGLQLGLGPFGKMMGDADVFRNGST